MADLSLAGVAPNFVPNLGPATGPPYQDGPIPIGVPISGTVRRWDLAKGFGFIAADAGGPDVFVHIKSLADGEALVNGSKVTFEAIPDTAKGPGKYRARIVHGAKTKEVASTLSADVMANDRLYVTGLPLEIEEEYIAQVFNQYGNVASVKKCAVRPGMQTSAALLRMVDAAQAKWVVDHINQNIPAGLTAMVEICYAEHKGPGSILLPPPPPPPIADQSPPAMASTIPSFGKAPTPPLVSSMNSGPYGYPASTPPATQPLAPPLTAPDALWGGMPSVSATVPGIGSMASPAAGLPSVTPAAVGMTSPPLAVGGATAQSAGLPTATSQLAGLLGMTSPHGGLLGVASSPAGMSNMAAPAAGVMGMTPPLAVDGAPAPGGWA